MIIFNVTKIQYGTRVCKCNNSGSPVMRLREQRYTSLNGNKR